VEFGKHISKGAWAFADKALPAFYGFGFILFVVRTIPPQEYGLYVLLQAIFLVVVNVGQSLALQPLVKFAAEREDPSAVLSVASIYYAAVLTVASLLLVTFRSTIAHLIGAPELSGLMFYLPLLFAASSIRNIIVYLFQAKLAVVPIFWIDALYFLGSLVGVAFLTSVNALHTAGTVIQVNIITFVLSSAYAYVVLHRRFALRLRYEAQAARSLWDYGKYSFGASASYSVYAQADNFIISAILGPIFVAIYNAAKLFIRAFDLLLQMIVFFLVPTVSRYSSQNRTEDLLILGEKSTFVFTAVALAMVAVLAVLASPMISVFYGGKYQEAVPILRVLALSGLFVPASAIGSSFFFGLGHVKENFYLQTAMMVLFIVFVVIITERFGILGTAWTFSGAAALMAFAWYTLLAFRTGIRIRPAAVYARHRDTLNFISNTLSSFRERWSQT
jgi:O-antigen/teichoic acid export membrane protein